MKIFDTHTHLNVEEFAGREAEELQLAKEMSVVAHNIVGFDRPTIERALELADSYDQLYATIGWHPTEAGTYDEAVEAYLLDKLRHPKVVALGEIGLDLFRFFGNGRALYRARNDDFLFWSRHL